MKKIGTILLVLLTIASCFLLTACNFKKPACKDGCEFVWDGEEREYVCLQCGNSRCDVRGHLWSTYLGNDEICEVCGKTPCQVGIAKHKYQNGVCTACGAGSCKNGEHKFDDTTGVCKYCGKTSCKAGKHQFGVDGQCRWCGKTACQTGGHKYDNGECIHCGKESAFAWIHDIFNKPAKNPDQGGSDNEWNSTCPEGNGVHGWSGGKCIYCGAVLSDADEMNFWDAVGQGAMVVGTMIGVTALASLIYWLGCLFNWSFLVWIGHGLMVLMTIGMFVAFHWIWGIVFLVLFGGAYMFLLCPMITEKTLGYNGIIH